jgi:hypothetical protein
MTFYLYVIKDIKSCYQPQVYSFVNDDMAKRWLYQLYRDAVDREPNSALASYPDDFKLFRIGYFETDDGSLEGTDSVYICSLSDFKEV